MSHLSGVFVVSVTPFKSNGEVDYRGLERNVDWWVQEGVHGVLPLGSTGEFASLDEAERYRIAETVTKAVNGRVPVVVGTTAETTEGALRFARHAGQCGASGVLVLPPFFYRCTQVEIYQHYRALSEQLDLPIMLYNNPRSAKVDIEPETVKRLSALDHIRYIKESSNDIKRITELRTITADGIRIFCGCEHMAYESFVMGATGWVSVIANIAPRMSVQLYDLTVRDKDLEGGWDLYKRMLPMLRFFEQAGQTPQTLKHVLESRGLAGGAVRRPRLELSKDELARIDALAKGLA